LYTLDHAPPSTQARGSDPHADHPNHATGVIGVIGLVGNFENGIENVELQYPFRDNRTPIRFGPAFRLEDLGAYASEAPVPSGGFVRLISPAWADAPSAAWRAAGFGRWIGVVLETDDLAATAAFFAAGKIPYRRAERGGAALWVD